MALGLTRLAFAGAGLIAAASIGAGCGPIRSSSTIVDASAELAAAETALGRDHSPYEMIAAEAYLHKAREEESYSDFEVAEKLAKKSRDCARVARVRAERQTRKDIGVADAVTQTEARCYAGPPGERPVQGLDVPDSGKPGPAAAKPAAKPADGKKADAKKPAAPTPAGEAKPKKVVKPREDEPDDPLPEGE